MDKRASNENNTDIAINEYKTMLVFKELNNYVILRFQIHKINSRDFFSILIRFKALLNTTIAIARSARDEAKLKGIIKLEDTMQILQQD